VSLAQPLDQTGLTIFLRATAVSCLLGAGIIHFMWTAMHFYEWPAGGFFFLAVAASQTFGGFAVAALPGRGTYLANTVVNAVTVAVWAVSRTVGMPVGPDAGHRSTIGMPDLVATLLEVLVVLALVPLLRGRSAAGRRRVRADRLSRRAYLALVAIPVYTLVLTCVAVVPAAAGHGGH
jgi:hypothetical protein